MEIKILLSDGSGPVDKLADAEIHFTAGDLNGLKLLGFAVWRRRGGGAGLNVTFPARTYVVNGDRRSFALLRPIISMSSGDGLRDRIIEAYRELEAEPAPVVARAPRLAAAMPEPGGMLAAADALRSEY